jgi:hypothetical protein
MTLSPEEDIIRTFPPATNPKLSSKQRTLSFPVIFLTHPSIPGGKKVRGITIPPNDGFMSNS